MESCNSLQRRATRGMRRPVLGALLPALLLAGCASAPEAPRREFVPPAFPPPPEQPRIVFERTLLSTADVRSDDSTSRLRRLVTGEQAVGQGFSKPFDVVACEGVIYVSDSASRAVRAFDVGGGRTFEIGLENPGALIKPLGLNTDAQCNLYVADASLERIMVYDKQGSYRTAYGTSDDFNRLSHVAASPDGSRVFAVDTGGVETDDHHIVVFDGATGERLFDIGTRGSEPGQLNLPRDIEVGKDGLLYVVDGANFRVQIFRQDGTFVRTFGRVGRQFGQFSRPKGIALDPEGNVYVSDAAFGNFQIFTPEGQLLLFVGSRGPRPEPARYMLPAGIDVDEDGRVYMVDQFFRKLDIYRPATLDKEQGHLGAWYSPPKR